MTEFIPTNGLEEALVFAQQGSISPKALIEFLLASDIAVPSRSALQQDGSNFQPLFFEKNNVGMIAAFSEISRVSKFKDMTKDCVVVRTAKFLSTMPREYGLVINPGYEVGFDITPDGIAKIVEDFKIEQK